MRLELSLTVKVKSLYPCCKKMALQSNTAFEAAEFTSTLLNLIQNWYFAAAVLIGCGIEHVNFWIKEYRFPGCTPYSTDKLKMFLFSYPEYFERGIHHFYR